MVTSSIHKATEPLLTNWHLVQHLVTSFVRTPTEPLLTNSHMVTTSIRAPTEPLGTNRHLVQYLVTSSTQPLLTIWHPYQLHNYTHTNSTDKSASGNQLHRSIHPASTDDLTSWWPSHHVHSTVASPHQSRSDVICQAPNTALNDVENLATRLSTMFASCGTFSHGFFDRIRDIEQSYVVSTKYLSFI